MKKHTKNKQKANQETIACRFLFKTKRNRSSRSDKVYNFAQIPLILMALFAVSCSSVPKVKVGKTKLAPTPLAVVYGPKDYSAGLKAMELTPTVPVFIFSTRNLETVPRGGLDPFGTGRLKTRAPHLAVADVSIGANVSQEILMEETLTDVKKKKTRVAVEEIRLISSTDQKVESWRQLQSIEVGNHPWFGAIRRELDKGTSREIVIFVHGYNTHLTSNTELLAEIYHYKARDGAVINFEWPSRGQLLGYFQDKGSATFSTLYFRSLLAVLAKQTQAKSVRIIGHSAGCPIVVNALRELRMWDDDLSSRQLQEKYGIEQVVLAAPDMDLMEFSNAVFDGFYEIATHVGVYMSPQDKALAFAEHLMGGHRLGRAIGSMSDQDRQVFQNIPKLEMVDVSLPQKTYGGFVGHGYFHRDPWVSSDIGMSMYLLQPERRGLVRSEEGLFWEFPPDYPERLRAIVAPE